MAVKGDLLKSEVRAIGLIVYRWSYLEHAAEKLIWAILEVGPTVGRAITSDIQFRARIKMIGKLIEAKHSPISKVWGTTAKSLQETEDDRNLIVHGVWGRSDGTSDAFAHSLRRKSSSPDEIYGERFPPERMKKIDAQILAAVSYLLGLVDVIKHANEVALRNKSEKPTQPR